MTDTNDIHNAAARFLTEHKGQHLNRDTDALMERCETYLVETFNISARFARAIAETEFVGSLESNHQGFIDIDQSTGNRLVLRDYTTGNRHLITLPELFQLVEARQALQAITR